MIRLTPRRTLQRPVPRINRNGKRHAEPPNPEAIEFLTKGGDERFDRLTRLARRLFDAPLAFLSLSDSEHQWVHSRIGVDTHRPPPEVAFGAPGEMSGEVVIVPDTTRDPRFRDHPLVVGLPEIRFYAGCPVRGSDGQLLGTLSVVDHEPRSVGSEDQKILEDLASMLEQELRSLSLAMKDELTGLTNRRGFDALVEHSIALCSRVGEPATLLYFDLDDFKTINDTLGHAGGDRVLRTFADRLTSTFRDSDVIARLGGDEFCVLLTGATAEDVERPLALLQGELQTREGAPLVAFRVGVASYDPERHTSVRSLVHDADLRMYEGKRARDARRAARL